MQNYFYPKYLGKLSFYLKPLISLLADYTFVIPSNEFHFCLCLACLDTFGDSEKKKQDLVTCVHSKLFFCFCFLPPPVCLLALLLVCE